MESRQGPEGLSRVRPRFAPKGLLFFVFTRAAFTKGTSLEILKNLTLSKAMM